MQKKNQFERPIDHHYGNILAKSDPLHALQIYY